MTTSAALPAHTEKRKQWVRRRGELGEHAARVVRNLQARFLREPPDPAAVSALARLRRGIGRPPGFDYTLDEHLHVPDDLLGWRPADDMEAADTEYAVHDAVTLYALHQQSRREPMHVDGRGLGVALAALVRVCVGPDGVRRRFAALGTASTYSESIYHLRSLVTLLRQHQIALDYGLLANDLRTLRRPERRAHVQAAWGREFYRGRPAADTTADPQSATPEEN